MEADRNDISEQIEAKGEREREREREREERAGQEGRRSGERCSQTEQA
jgi:hypothetical protein